MTIKAENTSYPKLTRSVLRRIDREYLPDVVRCGANAGFSGFTYYSDTVSFWKANRADILAMAENLADSLGESMLSMIANFNCLCNGSYPNKKPIYSEDEIARAIYCGKGEGVTAIQNAMAWFALEEIARELNPEI